MDEQAAREAGLGQRAGKAVQCTIQQAVELE
jgi:hypothetical protein